MEYKYNKRIYTLKQFYTVLDLAMKSFKTLGKIKKNKVISESFQNHIMLAVTEVNGCEICSYHHSKEALKLGMSNDELKDFMTGSFDGIEASEIVGILFAQHYAEAGGSFDSVAWDKVNDSYGEEKAKGILASIRVIMMGNVYGMAYGSLKNRLKGKNKNRTKLSNDLGILFSVIILIPYLGIKNLIFK